MTSPLQQCRSVMRRELTLEQLGARYPGEWAEVRKRTAALVKDARPEQLRAHLLQTKEQQEQWLRRIELARGEARVAAEGLPHLIRARLTFLSMERLLKSALVAPAGKVQRPSRVGQWLAERLLFTRRRERKAVGARWFRFWWKRLNGKGAILSAIQGMGIYCVYTRDLVRALAALVGDRRCLEVGAGDGTLSQLLERAGVAISASDDQSWGDKLRYPSWVEKRDAASALAQHRPGAVICSWPPPDNTFEAKILAAADVELYIVIGSRHRHACGNWAAYEAARDAFDWSIDEALTSLVMPPELDPAVLVFRRRAASISSTAAQARSATDPGAP